MQTTAGTLRKRTATVPSRPFILLALLPVLLLPSCEPGEDSSSGGRGDTSNDGKRQRTKFPTDTISPERIAAQNSPGKPPPPRDLVEGVEDECPVHHQKMNVREIPIVFVDPTAERPEPAKQPLSAKFPFGAEKIISTGNRLLPGEPHSARVYQCPACIAARRAAEEKQARTDAGK